MAQFSQQGVGEHPTAPKAIIDLGPEMQKLVVVIIVLWSFAMAMICNDRGCLFKVIALLCADEDQNFPPRLINNVAQIDVNGIEPPHHTLALGFGVNLILLAFA